MGLWVLGVCHIFQHRLRRLTQILVQVIGLWGYGGVAHPTGRRV